MKQNKIFTMVMAIITVCFLIATGLSIYSLYREEQKNQEEMARVLAGRIHDSIKSELTKPIMVGRAMANDNLLQEVLHSEDQRSEAENIRLMQDQLYLLKSRLGYNTAFLVSDKSRRYYTYKGFNKYVDIKNDEHDIWYKLFVEGGKSYDLDVDIDEVHGRRWTVFLNTRIEDKNGVYLGACGVGVNMDHLQEVFENYEKEYGIKINMINPEGLVQIDTNTVNIENAYLKDAPIGRKDSQEYVYRLEGMTGYTITKYVEDLGWYLVVKKNSDWGIAAVSSLLLLNTVAYFVVLGVLLLIVRDILQNEERKIRKTALTDRLTSLPSRNFLNLHLGSSNSVFDKNIHPMVGVFDIDNFKNVNDTFGHIEGDEILKKVSDLSREVIGLQGDIVRWGGDEFVILFHCGLEEAMNLSEKLRSMVESETKVTLSLGLCTVKEQEVFKSALYRADQALYYVKEHGRNGVKLFEEDAE